MSAINGSLNSIEAQSMAQYINTFLDLVDNLPNEITRHLTQLHVLHNNYLKLINRLNTNVDNYNQLMTRFAAIAGIDSNHRTNDSTEGLVENRKRLTTRIETQLIQMQELSDEKLKYSQLIVDLIETKAKELDLDYEEVLQFNGKIGNNSDISINNNNNKLSANASNHSSNVTSFNPKEEQRQRETNEDNSNNRFNDKRLLPRRACALKSGQTLETDPNDDINDTKEPKVTQNKTIKSKTFTKSHNFGLSMSKFYRDLARRRSKLPKVSKMSKIPINMKDKKSVPSMKRSAKKSKSNPKSIKRLIVANSGAKQTNGSNNEIQKKANKASVNYSSTSSSSSGSCDNQGFEGSVVSNVYSKHKNNYRINGRKESKRIANNLSNSNSNSIKKSKTNSNHNSSAEELFIGEPIDPNEPTYCLCSQVSYGEMICCDNHFCPIEWFHFPCVDLVRGHKPKGKWFCPKCRKGDKHNVPKRDRHNVPKRERHNVPKNKFQTNSTKD